MDGFIPRPFNDDRPRHHLGRGVYLAGGVSRVWEVSVATKRVEWANWDPSPFTRNTTLGIFCGQVRITILIGSSKWMDLLMEF